jgi:hypothetical protein
VDDAGYGDFGCHGHPFPQTPHIARLHRESVARAGEYEIRVRRWPFDLDAPLAGNITPPGTTLPIAAARLQIAGLNRHVKTAPGTTEAVLTVTLPAGPTQLHAWFQDAEGRDLCGAYFARVRHRVEP